MRPFKKKIYISSPTQYLTQNLNLLWYNRNVKLNQLGTVNLGLDGVIHVKLTYCFKTDTVHGLTHSEMKVLKLLQ